MQSSAFPREGTGFSDVSSGLEGTLVPIANCDGYKPHFFFFTLKMQLLREPEKGGGSVLPGAGHGAIGS